MESLEAAIKCGKIYKHTLAIFLLLPGSLDLNHVFGKRFTFSPKLRPKGPDLPILPSRIISLFPETGTENVKKVFPRLACYPETSGAE